MVESELSPVAPEPVAPEPVAPEPVAPEPEPPVEAEVDEPEAAPAPPAETVAIDIPAAAAAFWSGTMPPELRARSRAPRRAACISQEALARRIGASRPQLANAESGKFGPSTEAAARFLATIAELPERQTGAAVLKKETQE